MYQSWNDTGTTLRRTRRESARRSASALHAIVLDVVARCFAITRAELDGPSRGAARIALARQVAMYLTAVIGDLDHAAVGRLFDRDRTTVSHACAIIEDRRDRLEFDRTVQLLAGIVERERMLAAGVEIAESTAHGFCENGFLGARQGPDGWPNHGTGVSRPG